MLAACGIKFEKKVSEVDEAVRPGETPKEMVERLSIAKAEDIAKVHPARWVLGADTTVVLNGRILGKPADETEAFSFLKMLQGQTHEVWGGFALVRVERNTRVVRSHRSAVTMAGLSDREIERYISSKEPMDKAGAYAIQGIGASLIERVEGSYTNVVGLNLSSVVYECKLLGIIESR